MFEAGAFYASEAAGDREEAAFAAPFTVLLVPLVLALVGITFRGNPDAEQPAERRSSSVRW